MPDPQRLPNPPFDNRGGEIRKFFRIELPTGLLWVRSNASNVDQKRSLQPIKTRASRPIPCFTERQVRPVFDGLAECRGGCRIDLWRCARGLHRRIAWQ